METQQIVRIRLDLVGKEAIRFSALKEKRGLKSNSELVRQIIKETSDRENNKEA